MFSKAAQSKDVEIVDLEDIRREYNLVLSTLTLAEKFPNSFHSSSFPPLLSFLPDWARD